MDTAQAKQADFLANVREYYALTKPRVVVLILFTTVTGMFLSVPGMVPWKILILGTLGIGLGAASGAAFNQIIDHAIDAVMARTRARPLPAGHLTVTQAFVFSSILAVLSMVILSLWVNVLTAVLTFCSLIGYALIYTVFLKKMTSQNIVIGGAAGAAPPVLGWTSVTGEATADALLLFLIIFIWTPPHFWALALYRHQEYARAGIPMLPVTHGNEYTRLHILLYTILLLAVTIIPFATKMSGYLYLVGAILLNTGFLLYAWKLYRHYSDAVARKTFFFSITYLSLLFTLLLVDHYRDFLFV
ncbi:MAG TPA: protoheme IX farnesyltransferase [Acidiferrobacteraceae bacterium]|nr:protoheme IX farnesyltransferase [Acidiferrobacteraceae bacterium]